MSQAIWTFYLPLTCFFFVFLWKIYKKFLPDFFASSNAGSFMKPGIIIPYRYAIMTFYKFLTQPPLPAQFFLQKTQKKAVISHVKSLRLKKSAPPSMWTWKRIKITWKWLPLPILLRWMTAGGGAKSLIPLYTLLFRWWAGGGKSSSSVIWGGAIIFK